MNAMHAKPEHRRPEHAGHAGHGQVGPHAAHEQNQARNPSLDRITLAATLHCLAGCSIGEIAGMVIGTALGLANGQTILLSFVLAFVSGYAMTMLPLLRSGMPAGVAARTALAADTASIAVMEIVDNLVMWTIPGAMNAGLGSWLFWGSMAIALAAGGAAAYPINRWLIARGRGHAHAHAFHAH